MDFHDFFGNRDTLKHDENLARLFIARGAGQRYILAGIGGGDPSIIEQNVIGEEHQYSLFVCSLTSSL